MVPASLRSLLACQLGRPTLPTPLSGPPLLCSNPPLHGAVLVHKVLTTPALKQQW